MAELESGDFEADDVFKADGEAAVFTRFQKPIPELVFLAVGTQEANTMIASRSIKGEHKLKESFVDVAGRNVHVLEEVQADPDTPLINSIHLAFYHLVDERFEDNKGELN